MADGAQRHWCVFTSAGDRNAIRQWLEGETPRQWDLIVAYYGDDDHTFAEIRKLSNYSFRSKGSKFQNLKKLVSQYQQRFDHYSHVWVCDDDIVMSTAQINTAFELTERLGFWVAQPATRAEGKNSHWITCVAGPQWDYRIVNFVEVNLPIFRRDKLIEFLTVYDGSLTGWGIDYWYANLFQADEFGRFAIFDRIQVVNPRNEDKGGSEIVKLRPAHLREADWDAARRKFGLVEYPEKVFAYCRLAPTRELLGVFEPLEEHYPAISRGSSHLLPSWLDTHRLRRLRRSGYLVLACLAKARLLVKNSREVLKRHGWRDAIFFLRCGFSMRRQRRGVGP
jgi:hypothetical protein